MPQEMHDSSQYKPLKKSGKMVKVRLFSKKTSNTLRDEMTGSIYLGVREHPEPGRIKW